MKNLLLILVAAMIAVPSVGWAEEKQSAADEVDYVALSARMLKDGHYDRARSVLSNVDPNDEKIDKATYFTIAGLLALQAQTYQEAVDNFDEAIKNGKIDDIIFVYLAQGYWGLKDYEMTVRSVDNADEEGKNLPRLQLFKAQALLEMNKPEQAWSTMTENMRRFPDEPEFERRAMFMLVELGLYQEALEVSQRYLKRNDATAEDYLALSQALIKNRQTERAIEFLEKGKLLYPKNEKMVIHLAHAYAGSGRTLAAADLFQRASDVDPKFQMEAAELYRRSGAFEQALFMNAGVADQKAKIRQRVSILVDMQRFESVVALEQRAERLGLFEDQPVLYALAYARFSIGDYKRAEVLLKKITDPALFRNATQIRRIMAVCQENPDAC